MRPEAGIPSDASGVARCTAAVRALLSDPTRLAHFRTTLRLGLVGDAEVVGAGDPRPLVTVQCVETASVTWNCTHTHSVHFPSSTRAAQIGRCASCSRSPQQEGVDAGDITDTRGRGFFRHPPPRISVVAGRVLWRAGGDADLDELLRHELTHAADVGSSRRRTRARLHAYANCSPQAYACTTLAASSARDSRALTTRSQLLVHGMDLASCGGLACSEIRAASEAECRDVRPARRRACVRAKARTSAGMVFSGIGGWAGIGMAAGLGCLSLAAVLGLRHMLSTAFD